MVIVILQLLDSLGGDIMLMIIDNQKQFYQNIQKKISYLNRILNIYFLIIINLLYCLQKLIFKGLFFPVGGGAL